MIALTALAEQLFDIAERKRVPKVPAHGAKNQFGLRACRHLKIAARTAFFMISSGYQPHRPKLQHNRERGSGADRIVGAIRPGVRPGDADYAAMT